MPVGNGKPQVLGVHGGRLFQSAIGLVLVLVTNYIAKKIDPESGIM